MKNYSYIYLGFDPRERLVKFGLTSVSPSSRATKIRKEHKHFQMYGYIRIEDLPRHILILLESIVRNSLLENDSYKFVTVGRTSDYLKTKRYLTKNFKSNLLYEIRDIVFEVLNEKQISKDRYQLKLAQNRD